MVYWIILVLSLAGFFLSLYAWHVEQRAGIKKGYKAACDINDRMSCSKAFSSKYGRHFGMSNSAWGMLFYALLVVLAIATEYTYIFMLSALAIAGSAYLAYILYFRIRTLCVVCTTIYLVNVLLGITSYIGAF